MTQTCYQQSFSCPIGQLYLLADDQCLRAVLFKPQSSTHDQTIVDGDNAIISQTKTQLSEYFAGQRQQFELPIKATGTAFQQRVWQMLTTIDYAKTWHYGQLAKAIGNANASRAVGLANSKNPISIIIPCHRVIGATGKLTGYAGGLDSKAWLLKHETRVLARQ